MTEMNAAVLVVYISVELMRKVEKDVEFDSSARGYRDGAAVAL